MSKGASLARIAVLYLAAAGAGLAWLLVGPATPWLVLDTLLADVVATLVVFAGSRLWGSSSCYDAWWSVAPPLLLAWWWVERDPGADPVRLGLVALVVGLWAVRLTANWAITYPGLPHEDWRYPLLRARAPRAALLVDLTGVHLVPTLQVFLATLPVLVVTRSAREVGWLDALALVVGLGAVLLQHVSDRQLHRFTRARTPGQVLDTGPWAWSRHPNYFGELLFWVSVALFGLAAAPDLWWWVLPGPVLVLAILLGASIPMMDARSLERRPGYQEVIDRVPALVPRPPR